MTVVASVVKSLLTIGLKLQLFFALL